MSNSDVKLNRLPVFDDHHGRPERLTGLRVDGLTAAPRTFSAADLEALANARLTVDVRCEEGWRVDNQAWEGVSLHPDTSPEAALAILEQPVAADAMEAYPVSKAVNRPGADGAHLRAPV